METCPHCGASLEAGESHKDHNDFLRAMEMRLRCLEHQASGGGVLGPGPGG